MSTMAFAEIASEDYQAFLRLPNNDFPETFELWQNRQLREMQEHVAKWTPPGTFTKIPVNARDFAGYCDATGASYTLQSLGRFAAKKAFG